MIILLLVILGLIWGSFVNAFVWRLHEHKDWLSDRSECPYCHHKLATKDLVPVVSWLLLGGRCRYCRHHIDDSPVVELTMPILFVASYIWWPLTLHGLGLVEFVFWLVLLVGFVILAVYDLRWMLLPDKVVYPFLGLTVVEIITIFVSHGFSWHALVDLITAVLIISGSFYVLFQISGGRWIGGGDVKLGLILGLVAGGPIQALLLLFVASLVGTIISLPSLAKSKAKAKMVVPFGPFLLFATVIVRLFSAGIIHWYLHLVV